MKTDVSDKFAKTQIIHLEGRRRSFECIPASQAPALSAASCVSTLVPDQAASVCEIRIH